MRQSPVLDLLRQLVHLRADSAIVDGSDTGGRSSQQTGLCGGKLGLQMASLFGIGRVDQIGVVDDGGTGGIASAVAEDEEADKGESKDE